MLFLIQSMNRLDDQRWIEKMFTKTCEVWKEGVGHKSTQNFDQVRILKIYNLKGAMGEPLIDADTLPIVNIPIIVLLTELIAQTLQLDPLKWYSGVVSLEDGQNPKFILMDPSALGTIAVDLEGIRCYCYL